MIPRDALSGEGRALRDAVLAAPEDDVPRVLFAEWLIARGDPWGELIRAQCALGAGLNPAERIALREEERALLARHQRAWLAPYEARGMSLALRRGFVDEVTVWDLPRVGDALARVFANEPVRALTLRVYRGADAALQRVIDAGWLARLDKLAIQGAYGDETLRALARALPSTAVTRLSPGAVKGAVAALAAEGVLDRLWSLSLSAQGGDDGAMTALAAAPPGLSALYVPGGSVSARGVAALVEAAVMEGIGTLCLNRNEGVDDEAARSIARSPRCAALAWLELADTSLGLRGARALAESSSLVSLKRLDVRGTEAARGAGRAALEGRWPGKVRAR